MSAENMTAEKKGFALPNLKPEVWLALVVAALLVGGIVGHLVSGGMPSVASGGAALDKTTLTADELDSVVGVYTSGGKTVSLTAREVIEQNASLESAKDADGNYAVPTADAVLMVARNNIIAQEAERRGIEVTDDDLADYAQESLGSSDFEAIATSYSMDVDTVKDLLRQSTQLKKLRDEVVQADTGVSAPAEPAEPAVDEVADTNDKGEALSEDELAQAQKDAQEKAQKKKTKAYAQYIIDLAGDEWDSETDTWKVPDGQYAAALADYEVHASGASYEAAQAAYYVAYQNYSNSQADVSYQWTAFVNELLGSSTITLTTLVA